MSSFTVSSIILVMRLDTEINFRFKVMWDSLVIAASSVTSLWKNDSLLPKNCSCPASVMLDVFFQE